MKLAIVVGHSRLLCMTQAGDCGNGPNQPRMLREKRRGDIFSKADGNVYRSEPKIAAQAVENTPDSRVLMRHPRKLAVCAVEGVSPHEEEHPDDINPYIIEIKSNSGADADKNRGDGDDVGLYAQRGGKDGPAVADGAIEREVDMLLGVHRLQ